MSTALLLVAHGARDPRAQAEAAAFAAAVQEAYRAGTVKLAFVELARPDVPEGLRELVEAGAGQVVVVPLQFLAASHVKSDLPAHLATARATYPGRVFRLAPPLGLHARLIMLLRARLDAALAATRRAAPPEETAVLLVGRGTSDPDANGDLAKLARLMVEGTALLAVEPGFVGVAQPDVRRGLDRLIRLGARRIVLLPLLLFSGAMTERVAAAGEEAGRRAPWVEVTTASILGPDPALVPVVLERAAAGGEGVPVGRCDLCVYQVHLPGFDRDRLGERVARRIEVHRQLAAAGGPGAPPPHPHGVPPRRHVLVCVGEDCRGRGGPAALEALRTGLREAGRARDVVASPVVCFGRCGEGPMAAVYPDGVWYRGFTVADVPALVARHLGRGEWLVERFDQRLDT